LFGNEKKILSSTTIRFADTKPWAIYTLYINRSEPWIQQIW